MFGQLAKWMLKPGEATWLEIVLDSSRHVGKRASTLRLMQENGTENHFIFRAEMVEKQP